MASRSIGGAFLLGFGGDLVEGGRPAVAALPSPRALAARVDLVRPPPAPDRECVRVSVHALHARAPGRHRCARQRRVDPIRLRRPGLRPPSGPARAGGAAGRAGAAGARGRSAAPHPWCGAAVLPPPVLRRTANPPGGRGAGERRPGRPAGVLVAVRHGGGPGRHRVPGPCRHPASLARGLADPATLAGCLARNARWAPVPAPSRDPPPPARFTSAALRRSSPRPAGERVDPPHGRCRRARMVHRSLETGPAGVESLGGMAEPPPRCTTGGEEGPPDGRGTTASDPDGRPTTPRAAGPCCKPRAVPGAGSFSVGRSGAWRGHRMGLTWPILSRRTNVWGAREAPRAVAPSGRFRRGPFSPAA